MHENISYMAIAIAICSYIHLELEDQILYTGEINYPPLHSVLLNANSKGHKIFQRGPNISENFVPGVQKFQQNGTYSLL